MNVLSSAIGAVLAAIIDTSVLTHLQLGGARPDLVFALGIAVAMVLGFESAMSWALFGGLMMDILLPERALGATALALLLATGLGLLVVRITSWRRASGIAFAAFLLTFVFQALLLGLLAITTGLGLADVSVAAIFVGALLNGLLAALASGAVRALELRFGNVERLEW